MLDWAVHCEILIPNLFPAGISWRPLFKELRLFALLTLLDRGKRQSQPDASFEAALCRAFGILDPVSAPVAPLTLLADGGAPGSDYWLRADPVHLRVTRDRLTLTGRPPHLSHAEALDLTEALNRHFSQEGLSFLAPYPGRWYLKTARPEPVLTDAPQAVVGREVSLRPFRGEHATLWHRRLTEAQMLLHRHPVNQVREEQGQLPVNSLWIWGGGVLPPAAPAPFASVISDEPLSRGLACWSRTECRPLPQTANSFPEPKKSAHLLVLDLLLETFPERDLQGWQDAILKLERDWFRPLLAVAKKRGDIHWALHAIGAEHSIRITANRNDLWRFWRRAPG